VWSRSRFFNMRCGSSLLKKKNSTRLELCESTGKFWSECSRHAQVDNLRNLDPPITFDFTLSFAIRRICIHSWLHYYCFEHREVTRMYSKTTGVIHALKCVIDVTVNNRGKYKLISFHGGESNPNCQPHHGH